MIYSGSHSSIYFLIILMYSNLVGHAVNSNLYSEFNNGLDRISNYAENRVKEETSPTLDEIYDYNGELLRQHLQNIPPENVRNANKLSEIEGIEKLINALSPYHEPLHSPDISLELVRANSKVEPSKNVRNNPVYRSDLVHNVDRWSRRSKKSISDELFLKESLQHKGAARRKRFGEKLFKRFDSNYNIPDPKSLMNTAPSLYPNVVANALDVSALNNVQGLPIKTPTLNVPLASIDNKDLANSVNQIKEIQNVLLANQQTQAGQAGAAVGVNEINSRSATMEQAPPMIPGQGENSPLEYNDPQGGNIKNVLEKVLGELENIKQCKGNSTPEGTPCNVMGSWNSEVVGLRFDISVTEAKSINVELQERCPSKRHAWMDTDWTCTGAAIKQMGGPFYIIAEKPEENILATFSGLCKVCGGTDMVFGTWTIVHPAKDCQDIQMAIETKRDVFRRNLLPQKKKQRLELINKLSQGCKKSSCSVLRR